MLQQLTSPLKKVYNFLGVYFFRHTIYFFLGSDYSSPIMLVNEMRDIWGAELGRNNIFIEGYDYS